MEDKARKELKEDQLDEVAGGFIQHFKGSVETAQFDDKMELVTRKTPHKPISGLKSSIQNIK